MSRASGQPVPTDATAGDETLAMGLLVGLIVVVVIVALTLTAVNFPATLRQLSILLS